MVKDGKWDKMAVNGAEISATMVLLDMDDDGSHGYPLTAVDLDDGGRGRTR